MATHSGILAWRIPRTEKPGGLESTGSQRVRHASNNSRPLSLGGISREVPTHWSPWGPAVTPLDKQLSVLL